LKNGKPLLILFLGKYLGFAEIFAINRIRTGLIYKIPQAAESPAPRLYMLILLLRKHFGKAKTFARRLLRRKAVSRLWRLLFFQ